MAVSRPPDGTRPPSTASWRRVIDNAASSASSDGSSRGTSERAALGAAPLPAGPLGGRYVVLERIAEGSFGTVLRARDRQTGRVVAVKRLHKLPSKQEGHESHDARLELAREFGLVAQLRHPNVVTMYDYGFDAGGAPFFTMELYEGGRSIVDAGRDLALPIKLELLVETLRALLYVHRHEILHRDLKPDNVFVVDGHAKVLDFGLSTHVAAIDPEHESWAGTLSYVAPELLMSAPASKQSDLYSFGMIAYELLVGSYPFPLDLPAFVLAARIMEVELPRPHDVVDERLRPWLAKLLAKEPGERYASAKEVVDALAAAMGTPYPVETEATRESFLKAAPLVGRDEEVALVGAAVDRAMAGHGVAHLIGGESGVGKSRLLDEVRTRALVRNVRVFRGQAESSGAPYHVWRDVIAEAVLHVTLGDDDVAVLRAIVPDLPERLARPAVDLPPVSAEAAQTRLLLAVEELFRAQPAPVMVVLEDLHWAGSESLRLLATLAQAAPSLRLVLLGSYRDDEQPDLPRQVKSATRFPLERLTAPQIEELVVAMIGDEARQPELVAFVGLQSEGNTFFIVEVVRELAELKKGLVGIPSSELPSRVLSADMEKLIRRRIDRVPAAALPVLELAAVQGRVADPAVLRHTHPDLDLSAWAAACMDASVLVADGDSWKFAHDKLREHLLGGLGALKLAPLHRTVALAIEHTRGDVEHVVAALAHHWREAGERQRESHYAYLAGKQALASGACREAVSHLTRVLDLNEQGLDDAGWASTQGTGSWLPRLDPNARVDPESAAFRLGEVESGLTDAYFRLGELTKSREHGIRALKLFGHRVPTGKTSHALAVGGQIGLRGVQGLLRVRSSDPVRAERATGPVAQVLMRLIDTYFYSIEAMPLAWSILRMVNESAPRGDSPELARAYCLGALLCGMSGLKRLGRGWLTRAVDIADRRGTGADRGWVRARVGVFHLSFGEWERAAQAAAEACAYAHEVGDLRSFEEDKAMSALLEIYRGRYLESLEHGRAAYNTTLRSGDLQLRATTGVIQAHALVRLGRLSEAAPLCEEGLVALEEADVLSVRSELTMALGIQAAVCLRTGDLEQAATHATRAVALMQETSPVTYWMQSPIAYTLETLLAVLEARGPHAWRLDLRDRIGTMLGVARQYARLFPMGGPQALLASGTYAWLEGKPRRAARLWQRAARRAHKLQMPYEEACASFELGRRIPPDGPGRGAHFADAARLFERIGCAWELERVVQHEVPSALQEVARA